MKRILLALLIITNTSYAQNRQQLFADFKATYPMYIASANLLLSHSNVDPTIMLLINRVLPKIADENVDGAVIEVSNILYQKKGIKDLNPAYLSYIDTKCRYIIVLIPKNDYLNIVMTIADVYLTTKNFIDNRVVPQFTDYNQNTLSESTIDKNQAVENLFASPVPSGDWTQEIINAFLDKIRSMVREKKPNASDIQVDDFCDCMMNELINKSSFDRLKSITEQEREQEIGLIGIDCAKKIPKN